MIARRLSCSAIEGILYRSRKSSGINSRANSMSESSCKTCCWWRQSVERAEDYDENPTEANAACGKCHRHAPRPIIFDLLNDEDAPDDVRWPCVSEFDFCGEWQEAKTA